MLQKKAIFILFTAAFVLSTIFLTGCFDQTYNPATITFTNPGNGKVFTPPAPGVIMTAPIEGYVTGGEAAVASLGVWEDGIYKNVDFDPATGEFVYDFTLDPDKLYSICTFEVIDKNLKGNRERIAFATGEHARVGDPGVVDDSLSLLIPEDFILLLTPMIEEMINELITDDVIYGNDEVDPPIVGILPIEIPDTPLGHTLRIDNSYSGNKEGILSIGEITVEAYLDASDRIGATITVQPTPGVNPDSGGGDLALYTQGFLDDDGKWYLFDVPFTLSADQIVISDVMVDLIEDDDQIMGSVDLSGISLNIINSDVTVIGIPLPAFLENMLIDAIRPIFSELPMEDIPILDVNSLDLDGVELDIWPMGASFITTDVTVDPKTMQIDLGVGMNLTDWPNAVNPTVDEFWVTPGDVPPEIAFSEDGENIILAVSDDFVNQAAFTLVQSGLLSDIDLTGQANDILGSGLFNNSDLIVTASVKTPPVCNFSPPVDPLAATELEPFGTFHLPNIVIEIENLQLGWFQPIIDVRASIDIITAIEIGLSEDDSKIEGNVTFDIDDLNISILFMSGQNKILPSVILELIQTLARQVIDDAVSMAISIDLPGSTDSEVTEDPPLGIDLSNIAIDLVGNSFENNYLIVKLNLDLNPPCTVPAAVSCDDVTAEGFTCSTTDAYDDTVLAGDVISQTPVEGESVECGTNVELVLSLGPEPTP